MNKNFLLPLWCYKIRFSEFQLLCATLLMLASVTTAVAQEIRYVTDDLTTWVRRGPGDNYRLSGTLKAGEAVTLLQTDASTGYAQVQDVSGRIVWLSVKELNRTPGFRSQVPVLENQVKTLTAKLNTIETDWNQRTAEMQKKVAQSDNVIKGMHDKNQRLQNELTIANKKLSAVSLQLDDKQRTIIIQWFLYGGGVLGSGLILGLLLPHLIPRRKRKDRWMH